MKTQLWRFAVPACLLAVSYAAPGADDDAKSYHDANVQRAEDSYEAQKERCKQLSGNKRDVCMAEARRDERTEKADAEAAYKPNADHITDEMTTRADGDYKVAKEKCDAKAGNDKDICLKDAEAAHTKAIADAKAYRKSAEAHQDAAKKSMDADYDAAKERCENYAGETRDTCLSEARARYGKQ
ncbi:MAG: hypothetical protein HY749_20560 [Gammaproteobacteria bacterium]|nr:hypothetical protein [Gammaproteobacteria bacterium]